MEYHFYWSLKSSCFEFFGDEKYGICWAKKLMELWYWLITENFLFWTFWWLETWSFLSQNVDRKMIFTGYWEVLVLNFSVMGNKIFPFSQKVDGKIIFTWSFWAFHDIPRLGKYGFSCSAIYGVNISPPPPAEIILNLSN